MTNVLMVSNKTLTRKQFEAKLAKFPGVTWDHAMEQSGFIQIDTPKGKVFQANGSHTLVEEFTNFQGHNWKPEAYALMAERLEYGLYDCKDPDCDICEEVSQ